MAMTLKLIDEFCPESRECLSKGYYVYALVDPGVDASDPRRYFYVGKGKGSRCLAHAKEQLRWMTGEPNPKLAQIARIRKRTGQRPSIEIIAYGLCEAEALRLESIFIKLLKTDATNKVLGHRAADYWLSVEDFDAKHAAPLYEDDLGARVLLVSLNGGSHSPPWPKIDPRKLDGRVLGDWPISEANASSVKYVAGVFHQLVRCVYRVTEGGEGFKRSKNGVNTRGQPVWKCRFFGTRDKQLEATWGLRSISDAKGNLLTKFQRKGCIVVGG